MKPVHWVNSLIVPWCSGYIPPLYWKISLLLISLLLRLAKHLKLSAVWCSAPTTIAREGYA